jgi:hypothetical protein
MRYLQPRTRLAPALAIALLAAPAGADVVTDWNDALLSSVRTARTNPPVMTRNAALMNVSMYDAVSTITGGYERYAISESAPLNASQEAAAAAAAHRILTALYPADAATFDALRDEHLAAVADAASRDAGSQWGLQVADAILASRANDNSTMVLPYTPPAGSFWWIPTPPGNAGALLPNWPYVAPWAMVNGKQCRAAGPPPSPSEDLYTLDFAEVKSLGRVDSTTRTADQSEIALFWNDGVGTETPPGHWISIAQGLAEGADLSLVESARLFALLSITVADAAIVSWDNKYQYHNWRPVTGIRAADTDGNPATEADPEWSSFITTPPFPSYTSGHSTFSGSASRLLALYFGSDDIPFSTDSDGLPGVVRSFDSLSQAAEEAGQSRIYGGIHWQYDNRDAIAGGRALAEHVFANFLRPEGFGADECAGGESTLCLHDGRFSVEVDWRSSPTASGQGFAFERTTEAGEFAFFEPENLELLVKVLRACEVNGHYWVFAAAATDLEYVLKVTDHESGATRTYFNSLRTPGRATRDIEAFDCQ